MTSKPSCNKIIDMLLLVVSGRPELSGACGSTSGNSVLTGHQLFSQLVLTVSVSFMIIKLAEGPFISLTLTLIAASGFSKEDIGT